MSSEHRAPSQLPINKLYVNISSIVSSIFNEDGTTMPTWVAAGPIAGQLSTAGSAILRDMGKTVYLPANSTAAVKSTVMRKVQLLPPGGSTGDDGTGLYYTGYIEIGGMTYGGGNGKAARVARLN